MKYHGLYRGYVVDNDDSAEEHGFLARIRVHVPEVYGPLSDPEAIPWAWPCMQGFGGGVYDSTKGESAVGASQDDTKFASGMVAIPPIGSTVWVMFEQGDPQVPVWMGTWIGRGTEMPEAAKHGTGSTASVVYPKVFILKMPWGKDMFLRALADKVFELSFNDMHIQLKAKTTPGANDGELFIWTNTTNIRMATTDGEVTIQGKKLTLFATNDIFVSAGEYQTDPVTGEKTVKTVGSMVLQSTKETTVSGHTKSTIQAVDKTAGELQGKAQKASGFDKHGYFPETQP
jgi:hypothetical protein